MFEIKGSIDIGRPAEEVFAYLSDPNTFKEWEDGVLEMELTSEGPVGVGSKGRRVENYMGRDEGTWEVTKYELGKTIALTFESQKFSGDGRYDLEPADGGTRLRYRFGGRVKSPIWNLLTPLMMPMVRRRTNRNYDRLKQVLEAKG